MMKNYLRLSISILIGMASCLSVTAGIFNFGGLRTTIYSFSNKSFEGAEQEVRPMNAITAINNSGPLNVLYVEGDRNEVVVQGDKKLFSRVQTQYSDGVINISLEPGTYRNLWLQVVVYAKTLNSVRQSGSGDFKAQQITSEAPELGIRVTGSGTVTVEKLTCSRDIDLHVAGSGDIDIKSIACKDLDLDVTGSGNITATDMKFVDLDVDVRGSGEITMRNVDGETADMNIAGSGSIEMKSGNVNYIKARIAGSGCIQGKVKHKSIEQKIAGSGYIKLSNLSDESAMLIKGAKLFE